jgi:hypothetical protein
MIACGRGWTRYSLVEESSYVFKSEPCGARRLRASLGRISSVPVELPTPGDGQSIEGAFINTPLLPIFWTQPVLACIAGFLAILTAVWLDSIKGVTGRAPTPKAAHLSGSWPSAAVLAPALLGILTRREWRRAAVAPLV